MAFWGVDGEVRHICLEVRQERCGRRGLRGLTDLPAAGGGAAAWVSGER